ncbi:MAG TPA: c-type cytochrome [Longimicrobiaceae bacterium]|nr:c-type cytochrome [Longimicrobiaceae bacterium]
MPDTRRTRRTPPGCAALAALVLAACGSGPSGESMARGAMLTGGDPHRAPAEIRKYGCGTCHTVAGVPGADGTVGPPLSGIGGRMYVAGVLANNPTNLVRWIMDPTAVDSATAMPDMGVTEAEARDIAAYLYALD